MAAFPAPLADAGAQAAVARVVLLPGPSLAAIGRAAKRRRLLENLPEADVTDANLGEGVLYEVQSVLSFAAPGAPAGLAPALAPIHAALAPLAGLPAAVAALTASVAALAPLPAAVAALAPLPAAVAALTANVAGLAGLPAAVADLTAKLDAFVLNAQIFSRNAEALASDAGGNTLPLIMPVKLRAGFAVAPAIPGLTVGEQAIVAAIVAGWGAAPAPGVGLPPGLPVVGHTKSKLSQRHIAILASWYNCTFGIVLGDNHEIRNAKLKQFLAGR